MNICKGELERAHFNCFPNLGMINVDGLMVKKKSCFYHLPESMPIRHAFQGFKGMWFLHVDVTAYVGSDRPASQECMAVEVEDHILNDRNVTDSVEPQNYIANTDNATAKREVKRRLKRFNCLRGVLPSFLRIASLSRTKSKKKKKKRKRVSKNHFVEPAKGCLGRNEEKLGFMAQEECHFFASENEGEPGEEWCNHPLEETASEKSSEALSVTDIIKRYFSNSVEANQCSCPSGSDVISRVIENQPEEQWKAKVKDKWSSMRVGAMPLSTAKTPPSMLPSLMANSTTPATWKDKSRIGKRLVTASNRLGISASKQRPTISLCRYKDGNLLASRSFVKSLVYELTGQEN